MLQVLQILPLLPRIKGWNQTLYAHLSQAACTTVLLKIHCHGALSVAQTLTTISRWLLRLLELCILFAPDLPGVVYRLKFLVVYEIYTFIFSFSSIFGTLFYRLLCMKRFSLLEHCWTFCLCRYSSLALVVVAFRPLWSVTSSLIQVWKLGPLVHLVWTSASTQAIDIPSLRMIFCYSFQILG